VAKNSTGLCAYLLGTQAQRERAQNAAAVAGGGRSERTLENYCYHLDPHVLSALRKRRLQGLNTDADARLIASLRAKRTRPEDDRWRARPQRRILARARSGAATSLTTRCGGSRRASGRGSAAASSV
jgi:hypothetical protein